MQGSRAQVLDLSPGPTYRPLMARLWLSQDVRNPVVVELTVTPSQFDTAARTDRI